VTLSDERFRPEDGRGSELLVLVVDDRLDVLDALSLTAQGIGYECDTAESAIIASNNIAARVYDVIFIDLDMPLKSGYAFASEIRRGNGPNAETLLIAISAGTGQLHESATSNREIWPFDGFLQKPISAEDFQRMAESAPNRA